MGHTVGAGPSPRCGRVVETVGGQRKNAMISGQVKIVVLLGGLALLSLAIMPPVRRFDQTGTPPFLVLSADWRPCHPGSAR
ncbi:MAG: hypothetical protein EBZ36_17455 [Acidobacteria bacterium]|nr:hypothetical protein [Acidobacteriota bacterium]